MNRKKKNRKKIEIKQLNNSISMESIRALGYEKAKEVFKEVRYNLEQDVKDQFIALLKELKEAAYPILKKAHYYPIINEMDFLTDAQKNSLDSILIEFRNSYIMTRCGAWYDLKFSQELTEKALAFLYEKGILKKYYVVTCPCGDDRTFISEDEYAKFKRYYEIEKMLSQGKIDESGKEYEEYDNLFDELQFEVGCFECDGREITCMEDIDNHCKIEYKNTTPPDLTYSSK
jgi:hypothetical protein